MRTGHATHQTGPGGGTCAGRGASKLFPAATAQLHAYYVRQGALWPLLALYEIAGQGSGTRRPAQGRPASTTHSSRLPWTRPAAYALGARWIPKGCMMHHACLMIWGPEGRLMHHACLMMCAGAASTEASLHQL